MDYMTLNAIGIAVLAIFGLWAFQQGASARKGRRTPPERPMTDKNDDKE
ncbi:hypothetical protein [uncultured Desulfovibrio sp.]|nr:hypothetical protein [uncultured Desulfovibrio sp.]